jgi:hypothetical protein
VHRDVKPGNVLIAEDGRVKITDFGVSRAVDDVQLTRTGLIAGTPAFLAPEIARGHEPTAASDVFALGSTLYTAVEGIPPFGLDDNAYALLHKVAMGEVTPPQQAGPLEQVLMTLLATDPLDRPTASQAREALALVAAGQAPAPAAPAPPRRSGLLAAFGAGRNGGRNGGRTDRPATGRPAPERRPSVEPPRRVAPRQQQGTAAPADDDAGPPTVAGPPPGTTVADGSAATGAAGAEAGGSGVGGSAARRLRGRRRGVGRSRSRPGRVRPGARRRGGRPPPPTLADRARRGAARAPGRRGRHRRRAELRRRRR